MFSCKMDDGDTTIQICYTKRDMNSLSDVKIILEVSFIFASALGPVDNHAEFTICTTCQGIDHFFANRRPSIG